MDKIGCDYNIEIVEIKGLVDHIHMIVRSAPKAPPSNIIQNSKVF